MTTEDKLSPEMAEKEFERFADLWDIDIDLKSMGEDDLESYEKAKRPLIRGFVKGWLTLGDEGELTFELIKPMGDITSLTLDVARADVLAMDKFKDKQSMHKLKAYMASMVGSTVQKLASLDPRDEKRIRGPILLFLGS